MTYENEAQTEDECLWEGMDKIDITYEDLFVIEI